MGSDHAAWQVHWTGRVYAPAWNTRLSWHRRQRELLSTCGSAQMGNPLITSG
jgi:hypothetical protein